MAEKRRALGRGLGALIPSAPSGGAGRPVDVFFAEQKHQPAEPGSDAARLQQQGGEPAVRASAFYRSAPDGGQHERGNGAAESGDAPQPRHDADGASAAERVEG